MTTIESIQKRVQSFDYPNLASAIADLRVLLDELKRLKDENVRLMANHPKNDL